MPYSMYSHRKRVALIVGPYLLIVAVFFAGVRGLEAQDHKACVERRDLISAVRQVVDIATTPTGGPVDLSKISGFDRLDESTQTYLINLSAALSKANPPGQPSLHDRLLKLIPLIDC